MCALACPPPTRAGWRPIRKLMAANRGEIAVRIFRAASELNIRTVAIYSKEDFGSLHRYKADEAFLVGTNKTPVGAYLAAEEIVELAVKQVSSFGCVGRVALEPVGGCGRRVHLPLSLLISRSCVAKGWGLGSPSIGTPP